MQKEDLDKRFTFHPASEKQGEVYSILRAKTRELAELFDDNAPDSRELSLSITKLEEAVFWVNAAIARNGLRDDQ